MAASSPFSLYGVVTYDKDTKRKQFTTPTAMAAPATAVLWPMTKIQKESNSQLRCGQRDGAERCCDLWQRYKKKAIHNSWHIYQPQEPGVVTYDKDTKRKQFTTRYLHYICTEMVLWPMTKIQKESNSQLLHWSSWNRWRCCDLWQRYKKKAIHNVKHFESLDEVGVVTYDKDTKRKQFTTRSTMTEPLMLVLWPMTKIQKESNSQLCEFYIVDCEWCCDLWQRYKKKAIHNRLSRSRPHPLGVVTYDKDTKRKQFTTILLSIRELQGVLWPMTKIQKFMTGHESTLRGSPGLPFLCALRIGRDFFLYGDRFFCFLSLLKFLYCLVLQESLSLQA